MRTETGQMLRLIWVFAGRICHFCWFCHALARLVFWINRFVKIVSYVIWHQTPWVTKTNQTPFANIRLLWLHAAGLLLALIPSAETTTGVLNSFYTNVSLLLIPFCPHMIVYSSANIAEGHKQSLQTAMYKVCVEVLRPSQPRGVMSSAVSLPNHTITGQA